MREIKVSDAAEMLGVSAQAVRIGLQRNVFNFGVAYKSNENNRVFKYIIYPAKLKELVGEERYRKVVGDIDDN